MGAGDSVGDPIEGGPGCGSFSGPTSPPAAFRSRSSVCGRSPPAAAIARRVVRRIHTVDFDEHEQAAEPVAQSATRFCRPRIGAGDQDVEDGSPQPAVMRLERGPLDLLGVQAVPVPDQFAARLLQPLADRLRNTAGVDDRLEVAQQMRTAEWAAIFRHRGGSRNRADGILVRAMTCSDVSDAHRRYPIRDQVFPSVRHSRHYNRAAGRPTA